MTDAEKPTLEIDWLKTFAGALAATSSAVLLSTLGAAGTLIGAALGSVVVTVTSALYAQGLARSRARLSHTQEVALARAGVATSEVRRAQAELDPAVDPALDPALDPASDDASPSAGGPTTRERLAQLPWRRIAIGAGAMFLVAVVAISVFEVIAGRSVSSYTGGTSSEGGTSLSQLTGSRAERDGDRDGRDDETPQREDQAPTGGSTEDPTDEPTGPASPDPSTDPTTEPSEGADPQAPTSPTPSVPVPSAPVPSAPGTSPLG